MKLDFDRDKSAENERRRGLSFELVADLDWAAAFIIPDTRHDYGEVRYTALVPLRRRVFVVCFTIRTDTMRIISFRKANDREVLKWQKSVNR